RIFTPKREMPFAGHPTVGTAVLLAHDRHPAEEGGEERDAVVILEEQVGPVRCGVILRKGAGHAVFDVPILPEKAGEPAPDETIAAALGLLPSEIGFENHRPSVYGAGNAFTFVPLRNLEVIGRAAAQPALWGEAFEARGTTGVFLYTRETMAVARQFHARMFAPGAGIGEDPATGSAVAAFAGIVHLFDASPNGNHHFVVEQGFEMGRPSLIALEMDIEGAALNAVRIGGDAVIVERGTLEADGAGGMRPRPDGTS